MTDALVQVKGLKKYFPVGGGILGRHDMMVRAVDDVSFTIREGETFSLVGETGSGKSTIAKCILRLTEPTAGEVYFEGTDIVALRKRDLRSLRRKMQLVFQNPYLSLNPRMRIGQIVTEPLAIHKIGDRHDFESRAIALLEAVGLVPAEQYIDRYPRALSGGQRQRVMLARVLSSNPRFIVADEPVSALDVSLRSQILNLMQDLKSQYGLTYLLITHDLSVVEYMSDTIGVIYLGKVVEIGDAEDILRSPLHPYTRMLIESVPVPDPTVIRETVPIGDLPSALNPPKGCRFHPRCPYAFDRCKEEEPALIEVKVGHRAACFLNEK